MSPGSTSLLLLVLFCAGTAGIAKLSVYEILGRPYPVSKPGKCPTDVEFPPCDSPLKPLCEFDNDCKETLKCCYYKCGKQCVLPLAAKTGSCPYFDNISCVRSLRSVCRHDEQCPGTERCCYYYNCRYQCVPTVAGKPGLCPITVTRCSFPPPTPLCTSDDDCTGRQKCCTPLCRQECTDPIVLVPVDSES